MNSDKYLIKLKEGYKKATNDYIKRKITKEQYASQLMNIHSEHIEMLNKGLSTDHDFDRALNEEIETIWRVI